MLNGCPDRRKWQGTGVEKIVNDFKWNRTSGTTGLTIGLAPAKILEIILIILYFFIWTVPGLVLRITTEGTKMS